MEDHSKGVPRARFLIYKYSVADTPFFFLFAVFLLWPSLFTGAGVPLSSPFLSPFTPQTSPLIPQNPPLVGLFPRYRYFCLFLTGWGIFGDDGRGDSTGDGYGWVGLVAGPERE